MATTAEMAADILVVVDERFSELAERMTNEGAACKTAASDARSCMQLLEVRHRLERLVGKQ